MKRLGMPILAVVVVLAMVYVPCQGDQLPMPVTEMVFPGTTRITYADQTFVFTTEVRLSATFVYKSPGEIHIRVKTAAPPERLAPGLEQAFRIYWEEKDEVIFDGLTSGGGWTGIVRTEGGMTEK
jgi:hypothetical protein